MYLSITHEALNFISLLLERVPFEYTSSASSFFDGQVLIHSSLVPEKKLHCLYGVHNAVICYVSEWIIMPQKTNTLHRNGILVSSVNLLSHE
jgi:hypothetical protein